MDINTHLALGGLLGTSGSNSTGKPKKPLNLSKVTCATWRTFVGEPMSIMEPMFLRGSWKDFLRRVRRSAKRGRRRKALGEENEEVVGVVVLVFVVVVVVVVVLVFVGGDEATKRGGEEWRTSVMAGNERGLYLEYKKRKHKDFVSENAKVVTWSWIEGKCSSVSRVWDVRIINSVFLFNFHIFYVMLRAVER